MDNIGYAFIGTPKGLQTKNGGILEGADIRRHIDLDGNLIQVDPQTELFAIRKVLVDKDVFYFISQYEYAKEMESQRTGTFFGSTIVLKNHIAPAEAILLILSELMATLREYIAPDGRFMTTFERIQLRPSKRLWGVEHSLRAMPNKIKQISDEHLFVHLKGKNDFRDRVNFIHQCLNSKTFQPFLTVYASDSTTILNFVRGNKTMRTASIGVSYETSLERLERHYQKLMQSVEEESVAVENWRTEKAELMKKVDQLTQKQQKLSSQYKDTERSIVVNLSKLEKLEKALSVSVKSLQQQQQVADQHYQKAQQNYEADLSHFEEHIAQLKTTSEELERQHTTLSKEVQQFLQGKAKLQKRNQKLLDDFELISHNVKQSEQRNEQEFEANQALAKEKLKLEEAVSQLKNDYDALTALLEEARVQASTTIPPKTKVAPEIVAATSIASTLPSILEEENHPELELELSEQQSASA
ncbi:MAG: hypothetical protein AAF806_29175 [Bacteroidota bacterium]